MQQTVTAVMYEIDHSIGYGTEECLIIKAALILYYHTPGGSTTLPARYRLSCQSKHMGGGTIEARRRVRSTACLAESNSGEARRVPPQNLTVRGTLWSARACMPQWFRRPCFDWQLNLYRVASVVLPPGV